MGIGHHLISAPIVHTAPLKHLHVLYDLGSAILSRTPKPRLVRNRSFFYLLLSVANLAEMPALAQTIINNPNVKERPSALAVPMTTEPVIDGVVIDDDIWKSIAPIDQLIQTKPNAG